MLRLTLHYPAAASWKAHAERSRSMKLSDRGHCLYLFFHFFEPLLTWFSAVFRSHISKSSLFSMLIPQGILYQHVRHTLLSSFLFVQALSFSSSLSILLLSRERSSLISRSVWSQVFRCEFTCLLNVMVTLSRAFIASPCPILLHNVFIRCNETLWGQCQRYFFRVVSFLFQMSHLCLFQQVSSAS